MSLKEQITTDLTQARKNRDQETVSILRMVTSAIKNQEIDTKKELNDEEVLQIVLRQVKQLKDALLDFEKAKRDDLIKKTQGELELLMNYAPTPLSQDELFAIIKLAIEQTNAEGPKDMGRVMGVIMPQVHGKADGSEIQRLVKQQLSSQ